MAKDAVVGATKEKSAGENLKSPPKQESDSHSGNKSAKFYGETAGNKLRDINLSSESGSGGESHPFSASGPFLGETKGNKDRNLDLSRGTGGGAGGEHIAGRGRKKFTGNS
jgi:hypothetical protein